MSQDFNIKINNRELPNEAEKLAIIKYYLEPNNLRPTAAKFRRGIPMVRRILAEYCIPEHSEQIKHSCAIKQSQQTCLEKYGVEYSFQSENNRQKSRDTWLAKLGVENPMQAQSVQEKIKQTNLQRYGVENPMSLNEIKRKSFETRKQRGTTGTSAAEERAFIYLSTKYKTVLRQYCDSRYPFHCDFYIKDLDTFVELNLHWSHGYKKYEGTKQDLEKLAKWQEKAKTSDYYKSAIRVWTEKDIDKFNSAAENNLKYIAVYREDDLYAII